jgi:hypothetical protein
MAAKEIITEVQNQLPPPKQILFIDGGRLSTQTPFSEEI